jgi:UDP-GlcNAc:undecaprenyl-phosphate/decaprenyl-phosphate GlcNAc-1-phosphate transferase
MFTLAVVSFFLSFLACAALIRWAKGHWTAYDSSLPQRFHVGHTPRLGGLAIALGWAAAVCLMALYKGLNIPEPTGVFNPLSKSAAVWAWWMWLAVALPTWGIGVFEDFTQKIGVRWRLVVTSVSALVAVLVFGLQIDRLGSDMVNAWVMHWPWVGAVLALLAIAGLPHAFNLIDGYNGLASTVAIVVCGALAHVALQVGDRQLAAVMISLVGASSAFLVLNYPRGLIFAGDGGAYLWGVVIAVASILLVQRHNEVSPWFPVLLLIYPVWETIFSIYRKASRGTSPGVADALHIHQLIYRRIVREVFQDDEQRRILMRNNRTSPYLWGFAVLTVVPAVLFWSQTWVLMAFCVLFIVSYVAAYLMIIHFKVQRWIRRR